MNTNKLQRLSGILIIFSSLGFMPQIGLAQCHQLRIEANFEIKTYIKPVPYYECLDPNQVTYKKTHRVGSGNEVILGQKDSKGEWKEIMKFKMPDKDKKVVCEIPEGKEIGKCRDE